MNLDKAAESYRPIFEKAKERYPAMPGWRFVAETKRIMQVANHSRDLVQKRVLDLGCGSINNTDRPRLLSAFWCKFFDPEKLSQFDPWYCRIAHEGGADVTGVDIRSNEREPFKGLQMDLMDPSQLDQFDAKSFDGVNNMCLTTPEHSKRAKFATSPAIMYKLGMDFDAAYKLNDEIFRQVERILDDGGTYTLSEFVFRKKKGKLKLRSTMQGLGS